MTRNIEFSIGEYYHIHTRGIDKRITFIDKQDYERFIILLYICNSTKIIHMSNMRQGLALPEFLNLERAEQIIDIGVYCLMPNHFHILIKERIAGGISIFMQKLLTAYTMYFNKKYERSGSLFAGPFKATHCNNDIYLKYLFAYIHLNPIKIIQPEWKEGGITSLKQSKIFLESYSYSSYLDYLGKHRKEQSIINPSAFPSYFIEVKDFATFIEFWLTFSHQGETLP